MSADRRDEIDEVLSKYLPSKAVSNAERASGPPGQGDDVAEPEDGPDKTAQDGPGELTDGMFAWVKANLIFIFLAGFLALSLVTIVID